MHQLKPLIPRWMPLALALCAALTSARAESPVHEKQAITLLPRDRDGWTVFTPSADSRIIYVSSTAGDDASGIAYAPADAAVGPDPLNPAADLKPFKTIAAALAKARAGSPDWVLLKRGDSWTESIGNLPSGRRAGEVMLLSAYGRGERPVLKTGQSGAGIRLGMRGFHDIAIVGLELYAHTRDPASKDYVSEKGNSGIMFVMAKGARGERLLVEDCRIRFGAIVVQAYQGTAGDMVFRRNLVLDSYSSGGHSQGMYASHLIGLLLEENVFDHNGWLVQASPDNRGAKGRGTMFNHNTYYSSCSDVVFRGNMFLRGSSMNNKWRADETGASRNLVIDDNLYVEGEIGIGIGGNTDKPHRFVNVAVTNNVMLDIGRHCPTGRKLAWYLDMADWDGGVVSGNILVQAGQAPTSNAYGIHLGGKSGRNIIVRDNIVYGFATGLGFILRGQGKENVSVTRNVVQLPGQPRALVMASGPLNGIACAGNIYFAKTPPGQWFEADRQMLALDAWARHSGERDAATRQADFADPARGIESYNQSLGGKPELEDFLAQVRLQSRTHWRPQYTASAINQYIRTGFVAAMPATTTSPATEPGSRGAR